MKQARRETRLFHSAVDAQRFFLEVCAAAPGQLDALQFFTLAALVPPELEQVPGGQKPPVAFRSDRVVACPLACIGL
jgi:hypothetical protein